MTQKLLAPIKITVNQREWLEREHVKTGNSFSVIIRNLIQENINKEESKGVVYQVV